MKNPIIPANSANPVGTSKILGSANSKLRKSMKRVGQRVKVLFNKIPVEQTTPDEAGIAVNAEEKLYRYYISPFELNNLSVELQKIILAEMGDGDILAPYIVSSFNLGTSQAIANLVAQAPEYPVTAERAILSRSHQVRVNIVNSRVFEEMQNLNSEMRTNLNRVLSQGMQNGKNPRDVARQIYEQIGIPEWNSGDNKASYARALRIARTEMNSAHRVAGQVQDQEANALGINTGMMWFSALSPTTRDSHARLHGRIMTRQEINDLYSQSGFGVNCKCSQKSIVLNEDGQPRNPDFVKRIKDTGKKFFKD